jgi:hypothetical protein
MPEFSAISVLMPVRDARETVEAAVRRTARWKF